LTRLRDRAEDAVRWAAQAYTLPTANARPFPDVLIIGAQRAGTTSLYRYLAQHPAVMPVILAGKGVHFFDTNFLKGSRWYRAHFPTSLRRKLIQRRQGIDHSLVVEGSPYYVFHPLVPARVAELMPDVRLILMLRDPVSRAYSHYQHELGRGFERLSFAEAIQSEPERLAGEEERMLADPTYYSFSHQHYSYLARGMYLDQIRRWNALFPKKDLLILDSSEFFGNPDRVYRQVLYFLGLEERSLGRYEKLNARTYPDMPADLELQLGEHFREPNRKLSEYLGIDFAWSRR
jgi:hypothetical protein